MPLIYLIILCFILSPLTIILSIQTINFNYKLITLSKLKKKHDIIINSQTIEYQIANIYIDTKQWHKAIITLENAIHFNTDINTYWAAKYNNAIGFTLQKKGYNILAKIYYSMAYHHYPDYTYARNNLKNINTL
uniref:Ycf37 n=1 Tax=Liagoropsis maxima TaxID=1653392 RepID=A0A1G4NVK0_9FLOR|nr:Hypothetical protein ycf37 [Liagoropsis maxima]SCW22708.1 Hypothetical protein ycf37 [Liagoropsis maxima]